MLNHLDKHLNVFINYNEKYWLENNMTKAIVNTLELLDTSSQLELIAELVKSPAITQLDKSQYHCRPPRQWHNPSQTGAKLQIKATPGKKGLKARPIDHRNPRRHVGNPPKHGPGFQPSMMVGSQTWGFTPGWDMSPRCGSENE